MNKEFVMRGKTASGSTEVLNFTGDKPGYAYRMTEFQIWPSTGIGTQGQELAASVTAAKTHEDPSNPNFNNEGLIAVAYFPMTSLAVGNSGVNISLNLVNDTFLITQDLILAVVDTVTGSPLPVNWQCRFVGEKMNTNEQAVANYKQFTISDE
jgi:hypothetical protein